MSQRSQQNLHFATKDISSSVKSSVGWKENATLVDLIGGEGGKLWSNREPRIHLSVGYHHKCSDSRQFVMCCMLREGTGHGRAT